jgi:hypothetical protein
LGMSSDDENACQLHHRVVALAHVGVVIDHALLRIR